MTPSNPPSREGTGKPTKKFLLWLFLCLGLGAVASGISFYLIAKYMGDSLHDQTDLIQKQIQVTEELAKLSEGEKKEKETSLSKAIMDLEKIKFNEIKSKLAVARNEKMDLGKEITPPDKIREFLKKADDKSKITLAAGDLNKFISDGEKQQDIVSKAARGKFAEALKNNQTLLVPDADAKENLLVQAITAEIKKSTEREIQKRKENDGLHLARLYLERLAKDKTTLEGKLKEGRLPDFNALAAMFPIGEKLAEVNLYFAFEYFPKHKSQLRKIIEENNFGEKDSKLSEPKRKEWLEKHWKPMEELVSKAGIK